MHWRTARLCSSTSSCCISAPGEGKQEGREGGRKGERQERERERERERKRERSPDGGPGELCEAASQDMAALNNTPNASNAAPKISRMHVSTKSIKVSLTSVSNPAHASLKSSLRGAM